jgi:hypothetical protein
MTNSDPLYVDSAHTGDIETSSKIFFSCISINIINRASIWSCKLVLTRHRKMSESLNFQGLSNEPVIM